MNNNNEKNGSNGVVLDSIIAFLKTFTTVVMHKAPHLDEIVAYYLLRTYAGLKAGIQFVEQDIIGTEADHDRNKILPIGCGIDCRFNEHRKDIERIKGECATTLVAKYLGISELPEVKQLIVEVLACDTKAGCSPTQLAELVKVVGRTSANQIGLVNWTMLAIQAIINNEQYHFTASQEEKSLVELLKALDTGGHLGDDRRVREHMFRMIHESVRRSDDGCITELASVVKSMYRLGRAGADIIDWVETPLVQIAVDQTEFQHLADELRKQKMLNINVLGDRGEGDLPCLVVMSDSLQAPRAARYVGAKVVLVRNSKGNVMVSIDTKLPWLNLSNLTRMIRWLELPVSERNVNWKSLGIPGKHDLVPNWYYFKQAEQLFNGSPTNSAVASGICTQALVDVLQNAFHPKLVSRWCRIHHVEIPPSTEKVKDLEAALVAS